MSFSSKIVTNRSDKGYLDHRNKKNANLVLQFISITSVNRNCSTINMKLTHNRAFSHQFWASCVFATFSQSQKPNQNILKSCQTAYRMFNYFFRGRKRSIVHREQNDVFRCQRERPVGYLHMRERFPTLHWLYNHDEQALLLRA